MISVSSCFTTPPPLSFWFLVIISNLPNSFLPTTCVASPAGIEAVLDPLGDLVQVAPSLALHQEEAEKSLLLQQQQQESLAASSVKSIKTPAGTVKCSCQTVSEEEPQPEGEDDISLLQQDRTPFPRDPTKTIEIEIYKPVEDDDDDNDDQDVGDEPRSEDRGDVVKRKEGESELDVKRRPAFAKNSFTLNSEEGDDAPVADSLDSSPFTYQDRVFTTEEPTSFLSFLSSLVASSAQEETETQVQSESLRESPPQEEIDTEVKQESDANGGTFVKGDVNVVNHRIFDTAGTVSTTEPERESKLSSNVNTVYKAFRSTDLAGSQPSSGGDSGSGNEKMDGGNGQDDFFLWDFIYTGSASAMAGKKRERLQLGSVVDPFKGPRRRRRKRRSLRGNSNSPPVMLVYPVDHYPMTARNSEKDHGNTPSVPENKTNMGTGQQKMEKRYDYAPDGPGDKEVIRRAMQAAMDRAWQQYGPKGLDAPPVTPPPPAPYVIIPASQKPPDPPLPGQLAPKITKLQQPPSNQRVSTQPSLQKRDQLIYYTPPRPFLFIDRIFNPFQPMTSEWDKHVTVSEGPPPPPPEPGIFSRFLASYIDFEVNNHEAADLMRRVVFGVFIGFLVAGWIALGAALGIVPLKKLLAFVAGSHYDGLGTKRHDKGKEFITRDTALADISDKILLSLDADWLKRLEDRVMGTEGNTTFPLQVFCCILPNEEATGMVECQVTKQPHPNNPRKKTSAFKCLSDLIYNFHFGPREDGDEEIEVDENNLVNVKSKASRQKAQKGRIQTSDKSN